MLVEVKFHFDEEFEDFDRTKIMTTKNIFKMMPIVFHHRNSRHERRLEKFRSIATLLSVQRRPKIEEDP